MWLMNSIINYKLSNYKLWSITSMLDRRAYKDKMMFIFFILVEKDHI